MQALSGNKKTIHWWQAWTPHSPSQEGKNGRFQKGLQKNGLSQKKKKAAPTLHPGGASQNKKETCSEFVKVCMLLIDLFITFLAFFFA